MTGDRPPTNPRAERVRADEPERVEQIRLSRGELEVIDLALALSMPRMPAEHTDRAADLADAVRGWLAELDERVERVESVRDGGPVRSELGDRPGRRSGHAT